MELVHGADSGLSQVDPVLVEHGQRIGRAFGDHGAIVALRSGHAGGCRCVDAVVLPPASA